MTATATSCEFCGRPLPTRDFALPGHRPRVIAMPCDCPEARAKAEAEARETERRERAEAFRRVWEHARIPASFRHVEADFSEAGWLDGRNAVYLAGKTGRGKTYRACQLAKGYLIRNTRRDHGTMACWKSLLFLEAEIVESSLRSTWGKWSESETALFQHWVGVDLLIFDDIGKDALNETSAKNFFRIVRKRHDERKATIFTSQYSTYDLAAMFSRVNRETGEALKSRLRGWCGDHGYTLDGPDRRLA